MTNPVVAIIKSGQWKWALFNKNHPEYSAIFDLIERHSNELDFVLIGTSGRAPLHRSNMKKKVTVWDIPDNGIVGNLTYNLQLIKILIQNRPGVVIMFGTGALVPALLSSFVSLRTKVIPILVNGFGYYGGKALSRVFYLAQLNLALLSLRAPAFRLPNIFALSASIRDTITKLSPNLKGKITLISYPISPLFCPSKKLQPETNATPTILTVAAIDPRKGLDVLIKAVSLIPIELKPNVIINGQIRDQCYMQQLKNMVTTMDLEKWVKFNQGVPYDDLPLLYQSATIFVLPTRDEGTPVVVLEALHCGLPVIATPVGGIPDIIVNGVNGMLIKPDDPLELKNAILLLLADKNLRLSFARNSVNELNSHYYNRLTLKEALERSIDSLKAANVN